MRDVEHDRVLAAGPVLLEHARVLDRHLPAAERHHPRAERAVLGVERAVPQRRSLPAGGQAAISRGRGSGALGGGRAAAAELDVAQRRSPTRAELRRRLEAVLHEEVEVVALVQHLHAHLGMQLAEPTGLAVLLGDELLVERRDLDVEVVGREVEVGAERLSGTPSRSRSSVNVRGSYFHSMP